MSATLIACDGSCIGNGKPDAPMGWAWAREDGAWLSNGWYTSGTNQKAELLAIWSVLKFNPRGALTIQMDSQYALNVAERWAFGWEKRGWVKSDGKPVMNKEIIEQILLLRKERSDPIEFQWVKSHLKDNRYPLNTIADQRAYAATQRAQQATDFDSSLKLYLDSKGRTQMPQEEALLRTIFAEQ